MPTIFVSYQRNDEPTIVRKLYESLTGILGPEAIIANDYGVFAAQQERQNMLVRCDIVMVVIGKQWLKTVLGELSEQDQRDSQVRDDLSTAIQYQKPVLPILLSSWTVRSPDTPIDSRLSSLLQSVSAPLREFYITHDLEHVVLPAHTPMPDLLQQLARYTPERLRPPPFYDEDITHILQRVQTVAPNTRSAPYLVVTEELYEVAAVPTNTLPAYLQALGFRAFSIGGQDVIIPPVNRIPEGAFLMGSDPLHDPLFLADETPQHTVSLQRYEIGSYPLTVAEYHCFLQATGYQEPRELYSTAWSDQCQHPEHPVTCITREDAQTYAHWLSQRTGQLWRLPTEAEWEKAARGSNGWVYPWGNGWNPLWLNWYGEGPADITPVGMYRHNRSPYGCYDMVGNVWEWTNTLFRPYPYQLEDGRETPTGDGIPILRGGSWYSHREELRAAYRNSDGDANVGIYIGARLARSC